MERQVVETSKQKNKKVKKILNDMGIVIKQKETVSAADYKHRLLSVSVWNDDDLAIFDESKKAFENPNPGQW